MHNGQAGVPIHFLDRMYPTISELMSNVLFSVIGPFKL